MSFTHIRVTPKEVEGYLDKVLQVLKGPFGGGFVAVREYGEEGGAEHYHIHASLEGSLKQFRDALTRALKDVPGGNKHISIKKCDIKMLQYVCKGSSAHPMPKGEFPDVVYRYGLFYTDAKIRESYDKYWDESSKIVEQRDVSFPCQVEQYMKINAIPFTPKATVKAIIDIQIKKNKPINNFYVEGVAKYILCKNSTGYKRALVDTITERVCQDNVERDELTEQEW